MHTKTLDVAVDQELVVVRLNTVACAVAVNMLSKANDLTVIRK